MASLHRRCYLTSFSQRCLSQRKLQRKHVKECIFKRKAIETLPPHIGDVNQ